MSDYYQEMGWRELADGEQPNHLLHLARFLIDYGVYDENFTAEWRCLPPPAAKDVVKNLNEEIIDNEENSCTICLKKFKLNTKAKKMPCGHMFHGTCIITWLNKTNSCPFCRFELQTDNETYEAYKKEKKRAVQRKEDIEILHNSMFS